MKLRNILISFATIIFSLFAVAGKVSAETTAPNSININGADSKSLNGSEFLGHDSTLTFTYKSTVDGKIVYCTEIHDNWFYSGTRTFTLNGEASAKFAKIMENGYPNKSITGNKYKDYYITGLAIWYVINPHDSTFTYFDLNAGTYKGYGSDVVREVAKLVNMSYNASYSNPSIKVNKTSDFSLSENGKYYVSALKVNTSNVSGNYSVSLTGAPSGTIVTDANGNQKNTFVVGNDFYVKVPVESIKSLSNTVTVSVSGSGNINKAYLYKPSSSDVQTVTTLYPETVKVNDSIKLELNLTTRVEISKQDATTGKELDGAHLVVKDEKGNIKDEWNSKKDEVHVIENLDPGIYTLTETIAPKGYVLSKETVKFVIKADGTTTKVVMKNYPEEKKVVYISKQDATTGEELPGAYLEIRDENGNIVEAWISGTTPHKVEGLEPGKYYLTETIAPDGYELSKETVEFVVKEDGTVDGNVVMYNKPEVVEVPSTASFKTITASLIGFIIIGLGSMMIYKNYKKNEEN